MWETKNPSINLHLIFNISVMTLILTYYNILTGEGKCLVLLYIYLVYIYYLSSIFYLSRYLSLCWRLRLYPV